MGEMGRDQAARRDIRDRWLATPARLADLVTRGERYVPAGDEWPTATVVLHLLAVDEDVWEARLRQMSERDNPTWTWTEPELTGREAGRSVAQLVAAFSARRAASGAVLAALDDAGWARTGTHATFGVLDVAGLMREALKHDGEHLADLERRTAAATR
jgi:hypothetical protein